MQIGERIELRCLEDGVVVRIAPPKRKMAGILVVIQMICMSLLIIPAWDSLWTHFGLLPLLILVIESVFCGSVIWNHVYRLFGYEIVTLTPQDLIIETELFGRRYHTKRIARSRLAELVVNGISTESQNTEGTTSSKPRGRATNTISVKYLSEDVELASFGLAMSPDEARRLTRELQPFFAGNPPPTSLPAYSWQSAD